jgi:hypothetical protein
MIRASLVVKSLIFTIFAWSALVAGAQAPQPLNDNPGKDCAEYNLNVPSLDGVNHWMFWKQDDCIRVHVVNNPFRYVYALSFDEEKIAEDDVLASLGGPLGLSNINKSTKPAAGTADFQLAGLQQSALAEIRGVPGTSKAAAKKQCDFSAVISQADDLSHQVAAAEPGISDLETSASDLTKKLDDKENAYKNFQLDYLAKRDWLRNQPAGSQQLEAAALKLQSDALALSKTLTQDGSFEGEIVDRFEAARIANELFQNLKRSASGLTLPDTSTCQATTQQRAAAQKQLSALTASITADMQRLENVGSQIANETCRYNARKQGEFSWVYDQVYLPVSAVLANPDAFEATVKREGPFGDPTSVKVTLTRDVITDNSAASIPKADNSIFQCVSDPSTVLQSTKAVTALADIPAPVAKSADGSGKGTSAKSSPTDSGQTKSNDNKQQATTIVLQQPWFFGKARLVVSGGLSTGFLDKQEFQRSSSISGSGSSATSPTVIGLKTNTRFRMTPMLYGHTLLGSPRHDGDAWYATLGVTANSDDKGTDPEFLLGFSRSFVQQKFFATLGAYVGEKQKLDGGLYVGETIPSSLTGDLPVTKSYHAGFAFGISYRFTSSKDPKTNSSTQQNKTSPTTKKSGS